VKESYTYCCLIFTCSILTGGHSFGATRLAARYSLTGYVSEVTSGVSAVRQASLFLEQVVELLSGISGDSFFRVLGSR
jgi:hypothetical protein